MTHKFTPSISFLLGPPADPELLARFEKAQHSRGGDGGQMERCLELEPRLPVLLAERDGKESLLSELLSLVLQAPVRAADPFVSVGFWKGRWVASLQLRADQVQGPAEALARLFEESEPARAAAAALGLVLKLDWVYSIRSLPADEPCENEPPALDTPEEAGTMGRLR